MPSLTSKSVRTLLSRMDKLENCLEAEERGKAWSHSPGRREAFQRPPGPCYFLLHPECRSRGQPTHLCRPRGWGRGSAPARVTTCTAVIHPRSSGPSAAKTISASSRPPAPYSWSCRTKGPSFRQRGLPFVFVRFEIFLSCCYSLMISVSAVSLSIREGISLWI